MCNIIEFCKEHIFPCRANTSIAHRFEKLKNNIGKQEKNELVKVTSSDEVMQIHAVDNQSREKVRDCKICKKRVNEKKSRLK